MGFHQNPVERAAFVALEIYDVVPRCWKLVSKFHAFSPTFPSKSFSLPLSMCVSLRITPRWWFNRKFLRNFWHIYVKYYALFFLYSNSIIKLLFQFASSIYIYLIRIFFYDKIHKILRIKLQHTLYSITEMIITKLNVTACIYFD